ncbi:MAG: DNA repair protein RecO [Candidatus Saccharibacteria bacterium]|nr:DNA repair protein RecO [Candidatus Saccharibacteria bacterium]
MSTKSDTRTLAYVLRRTNYGEADRILNLLTPEGKISAMARGVRKEKSKLASNIEMFCLIDLNVHEGKGNLAVVTSAKSLKFYQNIITDYARLNLASMILKKANAASDVNSKELFDIVDQALAALNEKQSLELVETWFWFNYAKVNGEQINLYRDTDGEKLKEDCRYFWDVAESALRPAENGEIGASEIKLMRLMLSSKLALVSRVRDIGPVLGSISYIAKALNKL